MNVIDYSYTKLKTQNVFDVALEGWAIDGQHPSVIGMVVIDIVGINEAMHIYFIIPIFMFKFIIHLYSYSYYLFSFLFII